MTQRIVDENGFFEIKNNPLSRAGVFPYLGASIGAPEPDRMYQVYRPEEELDNPDTLASFRLLPLVDDHTMLGDAETGLTPAEEKGVHGTTGDEVFFDKASGILKANLKIFSDKLKKLIGDGKRELSCGYRCVYEAMTGTYKGQSYDYVQRNIRGNHVALVDQGRMGPDIRVLDAMDHFIFTLDSTEFEQMTKAKDEGETLADVLDMLKKLSDRVDGMEAKKAEDETEEEKAAKEKEMAEKKAADEAAAEAEKAKMEGDKKGMDALEKKLTTVMDQLETVKKEGIKSLLSEVSARDQLANRLAPFIGAFDHADKTLSEVAAYGVQKLGLKCEAGQEKTALDGYLHGRQAPEMFISLDSGDNSNDSGLSEYLNGQK